MKRLFLAIALSTFLSIAFAAIITITVEDKLSFSSYVEAKSNSLVEVIATIENTGSVTCPAIVKAFDGKQRFWSEKKEINPGGVEEFRIYYLSPYNETKNLSVFAYFCDETRKIGEITARPSNATKGGTGIRVKAYPDRIVAEGRGMVVPFNNPSNYIIPTFDVEGKKEVRVEYPRMLEGNVTFILASNGRYELVTVPVERPIPWKWLAALPAAALILYLFMKMRKHGHGKAENGRAHHKKAKGRNRKSRGA